MLGFSPVRGQDISIRTATFPGGMSGTHDSLMKAKADGLREANSAASRPAEGEEREVEERPLRSTRGRSSVV